MERSSEQSYEEMISKLNQFCSEVEEQCSVLRSAGSDCVDNTENDPVAEKAAAKIDRCASEISQNLEEVQNVIRDLKEEMEQIRESAAKADRFDD